MLHYTGIGQHVDQDINFQQNKTLNESNTNGDKVHLFEVQNEKEYTYHGQVKLVEKPYQETQVDIDGNLRKVWVFPIKPISGRALPISEEALKKIHENRKKQVERLYTAELFKRVKAYQGNPRKGRYVSKHPIRMNVMKP